MGHLAFAAAIEAIIARLLGATTIPADPNSGPPANSSPPGMSHQPSADVIPIRGRDRVGKWSRVCSRLLVASRVN
jgi:hypothetical protein